MTQGRGKSERIASSAILLIALPAGPRATRPRYTIRTTGLAGGLFKPYKGLLPALESKDSLKRFASRNIIYSPSPKGLFEGGAGNFTPWRPHKHFNYTFLRNAFCTALLNKLESRLGKFFKPVKADIYKNHIEVLADLLSLQNALINMMVKMLLFTITATKMKSLF